MGIFNGKPGVVAGSRNRVARVLIKFAPNVRLSYSDAAEKEHATEYGHAWAPLCAQYPGITFRPFFEGLDETSLRGLEQRALAAGSELRLASFFAILVPNGIDPAPIAQAVGRWPHVERASVEDGPVPPPVNTTDDPLSFGQGYLSAAPLGINASFAWAEADGSGIGFVDLEQGWTLNHEDLPSSIPIIGSGIQDPAWAPHGTAVLGIVGAVDNVKGVIGIAPNSTVRVVSQLFSSPVGPPIFSTTNAIASAIAQMQAGDILLLETTAPTGFEVRLGSS